MPNNQIHFSKLKTKVVITEQYRQFK